MMTRRNLALSALALKAAARQEPAKPAYTGALDRFEGKYDPATMDSLAWTRKLWEQAPRKLRFAASSRRDALRWQKRLRAKVTELLGGFPARRVPLNARTLEVRDFPKYRREAILFETRPGLSAFGYILTPAGASAPRPVVICIPGHGRGVDDIVGIDQEGKDRTNKSGYQHDFALQAVEAGLAAFAIEPLGFGCRRDPASRRRGLGQSSCQPAAGAALLLGETMIGWRVWDVIRACDLIETRPELDAKRIGCMGISGGGTITVFSAALEPRIRACLVSGYLCTWRESIFSLSHCIDNYVPGILHWAEMSDVAGLIAPRPLFAESGEKDNIFPIEGTKEAFAEVRRIYEVFGAADLCEHETFPAEHVFHGVRGLPFLKKHLEA
jgi:dienelactone hydrolase